MNRTETIERGTIAFYQIRRWNPADYPADPLAFYRLLLYQCGVDQQYTTYSFSLVTGRRDLVGELIKPRIVVYFDDEPAAELREILEYYFTVEELPPKDVPYFKNQKPLALTPRTITTSLYRTAVESGAPRADLIEFGAVGSENIFG